MMATARRSLRGFLTVAALLCAHLPTGARADELYRWTDADGEVHYTNDKKTIPQGVTATRTEGEPLTNTGPTIKPKSPPQAGTKAGDSARGEVRPTEEQREADEEVRWRGLFAAARAKVEAARTELELAKAAVEDPSGLPITARFVYFYPPCWARPGGCLNPGPVRHPTFEEQKLRAKQAQRALAEANEELDELDRKASRESVPRHWRR
jgi:Domain of unknown function (DUF4124)